MAEQVTFNRLHYWIENSVRPNVTVLGGSATPGLTLDELIALSAAPDLTRKALQFSDIRFNVGSAQGDLKLRETIATTYDEAGHLSSSDVIVANGTTGANHIVHQSLLKPGDHVICQYPMYGPCIEEPERIGCDISYLALDPEKGWALDLQKLKDLVRPGRTKLLVLNNPGNPTGSHFDTELQRKVISLCKQYKIVLHCDEIFRPLFNTSGTPASFLEHHDLDYDMIVVTSSLSKAYGMSGVRIGWIATRSVELRRPFMSYRVMSCLCVSAIDEAIATEALSTRCRPAILEKHRTLAKRNVELIEAFVAEHSRQCDWVVPTAGTVGFVRFKNPATGAAVDDVKFCKSLLESKGVLLAPATFCFEFEEVKHAFKGRVRMHCASTTDNLKQGLKLLSEYLDEH